MSDELPDIQIVTVSYDNTDPENPFILVDHDGVCCEHKALWILEEAADELEQRRRCSDEDVED